MTFQASRTLLATGMAMLPIACGWMVARGAAPILCLAIALTGVVALAVSRRGALVGVLSLAVLNGIPFVDTSTFVAYHVTVQDVAAIGLVVTAGVWMLADRGAYQPSRIARSISLLGAGLLIWWTVTLFQSLIVHNSTLVQSAAFGRDFLYFALLLTLLPRVRMITHQVDELLKVLGVGAVLFGFGQLLVATHITEAPWLVHVTTTNVEEGGFTRVYAEMFDLVIAGFLLAGAALLASRQRSVTLVAAAVTLLLGTDVTLQQGRARWIGISAGIIVTGALMTRRHRGVGISIHRRFGIAALALASVICAAALLAPDALTHGTLIQRVASGVSNLENGSGTVAVREKVVGTLIAYLSGKWPFGLGFIPPSAHYYLGLPNGSIRDPDVGVLNAIMTMGVVGAILIYIPVTLVLAYCVRSASNRSMQAYAWLRYGGSAWLAAALISSATLVTLFSISGLTLTAVAITVLIHPDVSGRHSPHHEPAFNPRRPYDNRRAVTA